MPGRLGAWRFGETLIGKLPLHNAPAWCINWAMVAVLVFTGAFDLIGIGEAENGDGMTELTPLHVLLAVMRRRWEEKDLDGAVALAKAAAPYRHGKPPASRPGGDLAGVTDDELNERGCGDGAEAAAEDQTQPD